MAENFFEDFFGSDDSDWRTHWVNMPEFVMPTRNTIRRNQIDISDITEIANAKTKLKPKYPVYIISKGRWERPLTARSLEVMGIDYRIIVEPLEYDNYCNTIDDSKVLVLPFDNLGQGSIPARNWVWEHSISEGHKRHWILDDNINGFGYQKGGRRINGVNADFFRLNEDFVDRYKNIALAGIRYRYHHNYVKSPYLLNTRIYSCILIDNTLSHRWRGRYNEDTDLSLRCLRDGLCTMLFTWCYCNKVATLTMSGGNTDTVYAETDNRLEFAKSLEEQHPEIVKVVWRYNRWHHDVDYSSFRKNELLRL